MKNFFFVSAVLSLMVFGSCNGEAERNIQETKDLIQLPQNVLNYSGTPTDPYQRDFSSFFDKGAWFGFGFSEDKDSGYGFSGPFLLTQENGAWISPSLVRFNPIGDENLGDINEQNSSLSHLSQSLVEDEMQIDQTLFFVSPYSAIISTEIENLSSASKQLKPSYSGTVFLKSIHMQKSEDGIVLNSDKSEATGIIHPVLSDYDIALDTFSYTITLPEVELAAGTSKRYLIGVTFSFPENPIATEIELLNELDKNFEAHFSAVQEEKATLFSGLKDKVDSNWANQEHYDLLAKLVSTLQNNWRVSAGALNYAGLFPSYHYEWFNGFWAWDSWKHAVALGYYDTDLAKDQIRTMYDYQSDNGFIPDCIFRDTTIENHNYRNTKAPLSGWAIWRIYEQDGDLSFLEEMYAKVKRQHEWWYQDRDHDKDGLCEYGSTDGSVIAGKWESGMDNAVRFDNSEILENSPSAFSLNQESVDLNAYLYAEKMFLKEMADLLGRTADAQQFEQEANALKTQISSQFYDADSGWFYDTSMDGTEFIKAMGCEGWIPLWANCATPEQAKAVRDNMMDENLFNTKVPLQTLSASHEKFDPDGGYWRGPNWLDQSYFGIKALEQYGFNNEAFELTQKLFENAEGVMKKGTPIRENYNPITGEGLESYHFSWSAAHYLLLLLGE